MANTHHIPEDEYWYEVGYQDGYLSHVNDRALVNPDFIKDYDEGYEDGAYSREGDDWNENVVPDTSHNMYKELR